MDERQSIEDRQSSSRSANNRMGLVWSSGRRSLPSRELSSPSEDVVEKTVRKIKGDSSRSDVSGVHSRTRNSLVKLHELLSLFETPKEGGETSDVHDVAVRPFEQKQRDDRGQQKKRATRVTAERTRIVGVVVRVSVEAEDVREDGHEVVLDSSNFCVEGSDPLGSLRNLDVKELLDGEGEALLVRHYN
jgi:hypothetical protein